MSRWKITPLLKFQRPPHEHWVLSVWVSKEQGGEIAKARTLFREYIDPHQPPPVEETFPTAMMMIRLCIAALEDEQ